MVAAACALSASRRSNSSVLRCDRPGAGGRAQRPVGPDQSARIGPSHQRAHRRDRRSERYRNDPGLIVLLGAAGIYRNNDAAEQWRGVMPQFLEFVALPENARRIIEQLGPEFLSVKPGAFVFFDDLPKKRWGEACAVVVAGLSRHHNVLAFAGEQRLQDFGRLWCRGDRAPRLLPQAQAKHQLVPRLALSESAQFMHRSGVM